MTNYVSMAPGPFAIPRDASADRRFGSMIQQARQAAGRSIEQAARLAGIESSEWAAVESGRMAVEPAWIRPMADALGVGCDRVMAMLHLSQFVPTD